MPNQPKTPARTMRIPGPLWDATKMKAAKRGETATDVVIQALTEYTSDETEDES
jgi:hypothetical protein